jgi:hypothetical protein
MSIVGEMDTENLQIWRANIVSDLAKLTTFLAEIDYVLGQRGER